MTTTPRDTFPDEDDNLPAVTSAPDPAQSLREAPTTALCVALGYGIARLVLVERYGGICEVIDELGRRAGTVYDPTIGAPKRSAWAELCDSLPDNIVRTLGLLYTTENAKRRWPSAGTR